LAEESKPQLILSAIGLSDGSSGIKAVSEIPQSMDVPVIFMSAYMERFLTGQRPEPTFVIAKPFSEMTVKVIVGQALRLRQIRGAMAFTD
jgi:CheY-like chemotaxis protein